jgi:hypothetical protein
MNGSQVAEVHHELADVLHGLVERAGLSSRVSGLAVTLARLDYATEQEAKLAHDIGDSVHRLHDLVGTLMRWSSPGIDPALTHEQRLALRCASEYLRCVRAETEWLQRAR